MQHNNDASKAVLRAGANEAKLGVPWFVEQKVQNPAWHAIGCFVLRSYFRSITPQSRDTHFFSRYFFFFFNFFINSWK